MEGVKHDVIDPHFNLSEKKKPVSGKNEFKFDLDHNPLVVLYPTVEFANVYISVFITFLLYTVFSLLSPYEMYE